MLGGSDMIAPELEQVVDLIVGRQEALRLAGRFELLHLPLYLPLSPPCGTDRALPAPVRRGPAGHSISGGRFVIETYL